MVNLNLGTWGSVINVVGPDLGPPPIWATPYPYMRMNAFSPTPYILYDIFTRKFFLVTKLCLGINLAIMKLYFEEEVYNTLIALADRKPLREVAQAFHIPCSTLQHGFAGTQSHYKAAKPQRPLYND